MPLSSRVLDNGLATFQSEADKFYVCSTQPTTFTEATSTYALGNKNWGAGNVLSGPADGPNGRKVTVAAITNGVETASGTATWWAIVDSVNSRLLATDALNTPHSISGGTTFTVPTFDIVIPFGLIDDTSGNIVDYLNANVVGYPYDEISDADVYNWHRAAYANGGSVSSSRLTLISALVSGLKADGIWTNLDRLWIFAAENQGAALVDLIDGVRASAISAPSFTADRGFTSNGTTSYIDLIFNLSINGVAYQANAGSIGAWQVGSRTTETTGHSIGVDGVGSSIIAPLQTGGSHGMAYSINAGGSAFAGSGIPADVQGFSFVSRTTSSLTTAYQNGSSISTSAAGVTGAANARIFACCKDNGGPSNLTTDQIACAVIGGGLSGTDAANLYSRLRTYMTAVGVP